MMPLRYAHANILFGNDGRIWALYRIAPISYPWLSDSDKRSVFSSLARFGASVEADFSVWRVTRRVPADRYPRDTAALVYGDDSMAAWRAHLDRHVSHLVSSWRVEVYLAVELSAPEGLGFVDGMARALRQAFRGVEGAFGIGDRQPVTRTDLERVTTEESALFTRIQSEFGARGIQRARSDDLQWLLRRAAARGLEGEPPVDPHWEPGATMQLGPDEADLIYTPLEERFARLGAEPCVEYARRMVFQADAQEAHQALLVAGALPEVVEFPGGAAELMSRPTEGLGFGVDLALNAEFVPNRTALSMVKRRLMDAHHSLSDEESAEFGASWDTVAAPELARELESTLRAHHHPPLLRLSLGFAVGAPSEELLEERVDALRAAYQRADVLLTRPAGLQARLWTDHLPGGGGGVKAYREPATVEQFAAMMPHADEFTGSSVGPYVGFVTTGSQRPVFLDPMDAARRNRPPSILMWGTLGSGKTTAAQLLAIQTALRGGLVVDVDPKPDHALEDVPELEGAVDVIELSGDERYRGALDPLRIAPEQLREDVATSYLLDLLPHEESNRHATLLRAAVRDSVEAGETTSLAVIDRLRAADDPSGARAANALEVWAESGLGGIAFARPDGGRSINLESSTRVVTVRAQGLTLPGPDTPRADYTHAERIAVATLSLLATYALRLISDGERDRPKLLLFDEAWFLLASNSGRALIARLNRMGRAMGATLVLATQQLHEVGQIEGLIGTRMVFGQETAAEAALALQLLGLDANDPGLISEVRHMRQGRCLMRDIDGRVAQVQIDLAFPHLVEALTTTPGARWARRRTAPAEDA